MYTYKTNTITKKLELVKTVMNCHPSVIDTKQFDTIFTREYARFEYFQLLAKIENGTSNNVDEEKYYLLESKYSFSKSDCYTILGDCDESIKPLLILTLYAHGKLLKSYEYDEKKQEYKIKSANFLIGLDEFYVKCKNLVMSVENGDISIEKAIEEVKPLYNEATKIVNHDAKENVCKKWQASTKEKVCKAFFIGLLSRYKLTRTNKLKKDSPLKSIITFEKYFSMWLVTDGEMNDKREKDKKSLETFVSYCNRK